MRLFMTILSGLCGRLSRRGARRVGVAVGFLLGTVLRIRRREVIAAIQRSLPEKTPTEARAIALGMYRHLGLLLIEFLRLPSLDGEELEYEVTGDRMEKAIRLLEEKRGLIILTAHLGNFEWLAAMAALKGAPLAILAKKLKPKGLNDWWVQTRARTGTRILPIHRSYRQCRKVLATNGVLGFMLDQNRPAASGVFVEFFGRPASTSPGLAMLSARTGAPVLPAFIVRMPDGRHQVTVGDPLPPPTTDRESIRAATQQYTAIMEAAIRQHPEQWFWLLRRWRTQPAPETTATTDSD